MMAEAAIDPGKSWWRRRLVAPAGDSSPPDFTRTASIIRVCKRGYKNESANEGMSA